MVKKKEQRLSIKVTKGIEETLKLYCEESKDSLPELYRIMGVLVGTSSERNEILTILMSVCFFSGVFLAKKKPKLIKKFEYEDIKDDEKKVKNVLPNYMG